MVETCLICNEVVDTEKHFWSSHKIRQQDYYLKYYNKKDLWSNEPIPFKTKDQYLSTDFLTRTNLKKFLDGHSNPEAREYCLQYLKARKEHKGLIYIPTQVELRSIIYPNWSYLNQLFEHKFHAECLKLGLAPRFANCYEEKDFHAETEAHIYESVIIDTREQQPLKLPKFSKNKLDFGDYALTHPEKNKFSYIERKSLGDLVTTVGSSFERFVKEFERAEIAGAYLFVLIEEKITNCLNFNHLPWVSKKIRFTPEYIFHNIRTIIQQFPKSQFLFVDGRVEAKRVALKLLYSNGEYQQVDCQWLYDEGVL